MSIYSHSLVDQKPLRDIINEWKREDKVAAESNKRAASFRSSLIALEKEKFDVFTEDSFGDMEVMRTTETGNSSCNQSTLFVLSTLFILSTL